jgi:hypothetical protein
MNIGMSARLKRVAKAIACLGAIELFLPGGTLIVLGYLLASRPHVPAAAEGERAFKVLRDLRGLIFANAGGCDSTRAGDANPRGVNGLAAGQAPPVAGGTVRCPGFGSGWEERSCWGSAWE